MYESSSLAKPSIYVLTLKSVHREVRTCTGWCSQRLTFATIYYEFQLTLVIIMATDIIMKKGFILCKMIAPYLKRIKWEWTETAWNLDNDEMLFLVFSYSTRRCRFDNSFIFHLILLPLLLCLVCYLGKISCCILRNEKWFFAFN